MTQLQVQLSNLREQQQSAEAFERQFPKCPFLSLLGYFSYTSIPTIELDPNRLDEALKMFGREYWSLEPAYAPLSVFKYMCGCKLLIRGLKSDASPLLFPQIRSAGSNS